MPTARLNHAAWGLLVVCELGLHMPSGAPLGFLSQQREPLAYTRAGPPVCAARRWLLRLHGGTDLLLPRQAPTGVLLLPEDTERLQDAVDIVEQRQRLCTTEKSYADADASVAFQTDHDDHTSEILVSGDISDDNREWGTKHDGFTPLRIRGAMSLRMEDGFNLQGPIDLQPSSSGTFVRWKWGCYLSLLLPQEAAMYVAGGPWHMNRCTLRAAEMPVIRAFASANLSLLDNFVGGFSLPASQLQGSSYDPGDGTNPDTADPLTATQCTNGLLLEGNSSTTASDCTLQYCGALGSSATLVGGAASFYMAQCFLFQNMGCGISIHEAADVEVIQCSMVQLGGGCFCAVLAQRASLHASNLTIEGRKWHDESRPGVCEVDGDIFVETKRRRVAMQAEETQHEVLASVDAQVPKIVEVWEALAQEFVANCTEVLEALESYCNATGAKCRRSRTGRQRLAYPRYTFNTNTSADMLTEGLQLDGDEWQDLPPLLLADFSSMSDPAAQKTVCVYVHLEPLILSALRNPALIADGQALLIEHSDRFLSRRRFGGDAARIVAWLAALKAYVRAGSQVPVRVKMVFDCLEEAHSSLLSKRLAALSTGRGDVAFLRSVDYVCIMHGEWLTPWRPCLITAFRGLSSHFLRVTAPWQDDLHSGYYGGAVREPFADLVAVLQQLTLANGSSSVPGLTSSVLTAGEICRLKALKFRDSGPEESLPPGWEAAGLDSGKPARQLPRGALLEGARKLREGSGGGAGELQTAEDEKGGGEGEGVEDDELMALGRTWFRPSLSVHGISGGWSQPGCKTGIPASVEAKLSIRFPAAGVGEVGAGGDGGGDWSAAQVAERLQEHVTAISRKLGTPNKVEVAQQAGWDAWSAPDDAPFYVAAARALARVHMVEPDLICEGGSLHIPRLFEEACPHSQVGVLSLGFRDATRHSDESLRVAADYMIMGVKSVVTLLDELAR